MLATDIGRLRLASILDGISFAILLCIGMPLKYLAHNEIGVKIVGPIHGGFFIALGLALAIVFFCKKLSFKWCAITAICALIPFAPFFLDRKLKVLDQKD